MDRAHPHQSYGEVKGQRLWCFSSSSHPTPVTHHGPLSPSLALAGPFFPDSCFHKDNTFNLSVNTRKDKQSCSEVEEQWREEGSTVIRADEGVECGSSNQRTTSWWKTSGGAERRKRRREVRSEGGRWEDPAVGHRSALTRRSTP